jgi:hypothetical protein
MKTRTRGGGLFLALALGFAVACGGATASSSSGSDVDPSDIFPSDTTQIVITEKGGFPDDGPDGSTCTQVDATYTLALPSRALSWKVCDATNGGPYAFASGQTTLSEADFAPIAQALHALHRATQTGCGADKPAETIVFTTPAGATTYHDDFYFCDAKDTKLYVTGLDTLRTAVRERAK